MSRIVEGNIVRWCSKGYYRVLSVTTETAFFGGPRQVARLERVLSDGLEGIPNWYKNQVQCPIDECELVDEDWIAERAYILRELIKKWEVKSPSTESSSSATSSE